MKTLLSFCITLLGISFFSIHAQKHCPLKYDINPISFFNETTKLREKKLYDSIITILQAKINADTTELWPHYQLACMYSLKKDTMQPFEIIYKYIDLSKFAEDLLTDTDLEPLYPTLQWKELRDSIISLYLSQYPDITDKELSVKLWFLGMKDQSQRTLSANDKRILKDSILYNSLNKQYQSDIQQGRDFVYRLVEKNIIPTYSMVGKKASDAFLLILSHQSNTSINEKVIPLLQQVAKEKQISSVYFAINYDRHLISQGKKQWYGTQYFSYLAEDINGNTIKATDYFISPIEDEKNVNQRRIEVGLEPIEEFAKQIGINYKYDAKLDKLPAEEAFAEVRKKAWKQREETVKKIEEEKATKK